MVKCPGKTKRETEWNSQFPPHADVATWSGARVKNDQKKTMSKITSDYTRLVCRVICSWKGILKDKSIRELLNWKPVLDRCKSKQVEALVNSSDFRIPKDSYMAV